MDYTMGWPGTEPGYLPHRAKQLQLRLKSKEEVTTNEKQNDHMKSNALQRDVT